MSRIGIDCRFASLPVGLGTYARNLVPELAPLLGSHEVVLFVRSTDEDWINSVGSDVHIVEMNIPHYSCAEQIRFPKILREENIDFLFSPHFNVPLRCPVPFAATIHDLILHRYPNQASVLKRIAYFILMKHAVIRAKSLIAVSEFTKRELLATYGESIASKISVVTEGLDGTQASARQDSHEVLRRHDLRPGFLLYVGNAKQHKNVQMLVDAHRQSPDVAHLVLVTGGPEAARLRVHDRVTILSGVSHEDLAALYKEARCFVTPSLYEGFCLPILEARAAGCPVIAIRASAVPEVAGDHAALVAPDIDALKEAITHPPTESDPPPREMTWKHAAEDTATIILSGLHG